MESPGVYTLIHDTAHKALTKRQAQRRLIAHRWAAGIHTGGIVGAVAALVAALHRSPEPDVAVVVEIGPDGESCFIAFVGNSKNSMAAAEHIAEAHNRWLDDQEGANRG